MTVTNYDKNGDPFTVRMPLCSREIFICSITPNLSFTFSVACPLFRTELPAYLPLSSNKSSTPGQTSHFLGVLEDIRRRLAWSTWRRKDEASFISSSYVKTRPVSISSSYFNRVCRDEKGLFFARHDAQIHRQAPHMQSVDASDGSSNRDERRLRRAASSAASLRARTRKTVELQRDDKESNKRLRNTHAYYFPNKPKNKDKK